MTIKNLNRMRRNLKRAEAMGRTLEVIFRPARPGERVGAINRGYVAASVILTTGEILEGREANRWYPYLAYVSGSEAWARHALV